MITGWLPAFAPKGSWLGMDPGGRDTMGARGARQGPIPHQTQCSHWGWLEVDELFPGGIWQRFWLLRVGVAAMAGP